MQADKNPDYLRSVADALTAFQGLFEQFMGLHVENKEIARGVAPAVYPRDGVTPEEIAKVRAEVARAAGRASEAVPLTHSYMLVQGVGKIDPIAAWQAITEPKPVVEPDNVLGICDQALGRLDALIAKAEAEAPPAVGLEAMHPPWCGPPQVRCWSDGHYRQAVTAAAESLVALLSTRTVRNDLDATASWQEAFSNKEPLPGKPRLRWPGDQADLNVKTMTDGLRQFAPGLQMTIRNTATHTTDALDPQAAMERLAALSLLTRWVSACQLIQAPEDTSDKAG
jgi:hypothetical protein